MSAVFNGFIAQASRLNFFFSGRQCSFCIRINYPGKCTGLGKVSITQLPTHPVLKTETVQHPIKQWTLMITLHIIFVLMCFYYLILELCCDFGLGQSSGMINEVWSELGLRSDCWIFSEYTKIMFVCVRECVRLRVCVWQVAAAAWILGVLNVFRLTCSPCCLHAVIASSRSWRLCSTAIRWGWYTGTWRWVKCRCLSVQLCVCLCGLWVCWCVEGFNGVFVCLWLVQ